MKRRSQAARLVVLLCSSLVLLVLLVTRWVQASSSADAPAQGTPSLPVPTAKGLPVVIRTGLQYIEVSEVDENAGTFTATVDLRLRWEDPQLRGKEPLDIRGAEVESALTTIWFPEIALGNMVGEPSFRERGLQTTADGEVELLERTTGTFRTPFRVQRFPFDRHPLEVEVVVRGATFDKVVLDYHQDDVAYSHAARGLEVQGWLPQVVDLRRSPVSGWHGTFHSRVVAGLWVQRDWAVVLATVFIPLFSALLIPLLSIWLHQVEEDGTFKVEAFELANVLIGGLFAIIALNFTINAAYETVASGDNTVTRLFGLNYFTLGVGLVVDIALFRFDLARRWFGRWIQEQLFLVLLWAVPALSIGTACAIVAAAAAG
jgi:hypothetical protein